MTNRQNQDPSSPHHPYSSERFEIPPRTSSKTSCDAQATLAGLREVEKDLRRKVSNLSTLSSLSSNSVELELKREQLRNHQEQYLQLHYGLKESHDDLQLTEKEYRRQIRQCFNKRAKFADEELVMERQFDKIAAKIAEDQLESGVDIQFAYREAITSIYSPYEQSADWERRRDSEQSIWRNALKEYLNVAGPEDELWCPIMKTYMPSDMCTAAHIMPHFIGYVNAVHLLGEPGMGHDIIRSVRNGLFLQSWLERALDKGIFNSRTCIRPGASRVETRALGRETPQHQSRL